MMCFDAMAIRMAVREQEREEDDLFQRQVLHPHLLSLPIWHIQSYGKASRKDE